MFRIIFVFLLMALSAPALDVRSREPYYGAAVIDADTGVILAEDHAAAQGYPASMIKLANLFVLFDDLRAGKIHLTDRVVVSREVAQIGGRQVWLKEGEVFSVEELMFAMMIHSANDAAAALAIHASGSRDAHAARMTAKAKELGLRNTEFGSVHGLPPGTGQKADVSSALDIALLSRALILHYPQTFKYTSVSSRDFREEKPVRLTTSNKLLATFRGCDGLKTGYISAGGFSTAVTAQRDGRRVIAVILGSKEAKVRDAKAAEWLEKGFALVHQKAPLPVKEDAVELPAVITQDSAPATETVKRKNHFMLPLSIGIPVAAVVVIVLLNRRRTGRDNRGRFEI